MAPELRIAEVARRSGFTTPALRYYEEIGLLPPPRRTAAGYRAYDEPVFERLALIARAKQLGCRLDEIAELGAAWDRGECGPVQDRLRQLLADKDADAQGEIRALTARTAALRRAAAALAHPPVAGPCDDTCGCGSEVAAGEAHGCTLSATDIATRVAEWHTLLAEASVERSTIPGGVRLELDASADVARIVELVAAEQRCCPFFAFTLTIDDRGIALEVRAPDGQRPLVHLLFGTAAPST